MAIHQYETPEGETRWKVYVNMRSKQNPTLRIQRKIKEIASLKEAEREEFRLIRECERELQKQETKGETWGTLVEKFDYYLMDTPDCGMLEATKNDYLAALRTHTYCWWNMLAIDITKSDFRELLRDLKNDGYSVSHQKKMKSFVNRAFQFGIDHRLLPGLLHSPTLGVSLSREEEKKPEILTLTEIKKLLESARELNSPWYSTWAMALLTGMRSGELYALEWDDIDFEHKSISVNKSHNSKTRKIKSTKSGSWRSVPISSELNRLLQALKTSQGKNSKHVLPRCWKWEQGLQAQELRAFCVGLGITSVRFHALRACFATQLIRAAVPPIQIQKICGWKDLKTMQRYIRLAGIEIEGATEVLKVLPTQKIFDDLGRNLADRKKVK